MTNPLNNGCKPNEHYNKSRASVLLGVSRPTLDKYIKEGLIKMSLHERLLSLTIKGTELIGFYNSRS